METDVNIFRRSSGLDGTFGELWHKGEILCFTGERPWLNNQHSISCIPVGVYECGPHSGTKFHDVWEIKNVKDRSGVLIHAGNIPLIDSSGCILVGLRLGILEKRPAVLYSQIALKKLRDTLPSNFWLTIQ